MKKIFSIAPHMVEFCTLPSTCAYLDDRDARMEYRYIKGCSFSLNDKLVRSGWRRFGEYFSRPQCENCQECLSLRVDAINYTFSKSAKRTIKKNSTTSIVMRTPSATNEHVALYNKYHEFMREKKGWKHFELSLQNYYELYVNGYEDFGYEVLYFHEGRLVGVDLIDLVEDGISSIYFFYDPDVASLSLGRYSIYQQIYFAQKKGLRWIYLGYYVKDCPSLNYKDIYKPYEILRGSPALTCKPIWE